MSRHTRSAIKRGEKYTFEVMGDKPPKSGKKKVPKNLANLLLSPYKQISIGDFHNAESRDSDIEIVDYREPESSSDESNQVYASPQLRASAVKNTLKNTRLIQKWSPGKVEMKRKLSHVSDRVQDYDKEPEKGDEIPFYVPSMAADFTEMCDFGPEIPGAPVELQSMYFKSMSKMCKLLSMKVEYNELELNKLNSRFAAMQHSVAGKAPVVCRFDDQKVSAVAKLEAAAYKVQDIVQKQSAQLRLLHNSVLAVRKDLESCMEARMRMLNVELQRVADIAETNKVDIEELMGEKPGFRNTTSSTPETTLQDFELEMLHNIKLNEPIMELPTWHGNDVQAETEIKLHTAAKSEEPYTTSPDSTRENATSYPLSEAEDTWITITEHEDYVEVEISASLQRQIPSAPPAYCDANYSEIETCRLAELTPQEHPAVETSVLVGPGNNSANKSFPDLTPAPGEILPMPETKKFIADLMTIKGLSSLDAMKFIVTTWSKTQDPGLDIIDNSSQKLAALKAKLDAMEAKGGPVEDDEMNHVIMELNTLNEVRKQEHHSATHLTTQLEIQPEVYWDMRHTCLKTRGVLVQDDYDNMQKMYGVADMDVLMLVHGHIRKRFKQHNFDVDLDKTIKMTWSRLERKRKEKKKKTEELLSSTKDEKKDKKKNPNDSTPNVSIVKNPSKEKCIQTIENLLKSVQKLKDVKPRSVHGHFDRVKQMLEGHNITADYYINRMVYFSLDNEVWAEIQPTLKSFSWQTATAEEFQKLLMGTTPRTEIYARQLFPTLMRRPKQTWTAFLQVCIEVAQEAFPKMTIEDMYPDIIQLLHKSVTDKTVYAALAADVKTSKNPTEFVQHITLQEQKLKHQAKAVEIKTKTKAVKAIEVEEEEEQVSQEEEEEEVVYFVKRSADKDKQKRVYKSPGYLKWKEKTSSTTTDKDKVAQVKRTLDTFRKMKLTDKKPQKQQRSDACFNCGEKGHWARECPQLGKDMVRSMDDETLAEYINTLHEKLNDMRGAAEDEEKE